MNVTSVYEKKNIIPLKLPLKINQHPYPINLNKMLSRNLKRKDKFLFLFYENLRVAHKLK